MAEITSEVDGLAAPVDVSDNSANQDITANATALSGHAVIAGYTNNLTPPVDTSFWRYQTFSVFNRELLKTPPPADPLPGYPIEWLTWNIDAYVYATNARPDGEFQKSGGAVYVVLVHRGKAEALMLFDPLEYQYTVTLKSNGGSAESQLPSTDSGTSHNDTWTYPIRFNQNMQMFKNGGMEPLTFQATYEHDFSVKNGEQKGLVESSTSVRWSIAFKKADNTDFPITALSVFRINHLGTITFDCTASVRRTEGSKWDSPIDSVTKTITVDCPFTAWFLVWPYGLETFVPT